MVSGWNCPPHKKDMFWARCASILERTFSPSVWWVPRSIVASHSFIKLPPCLTTLAIRGAFSVFCHKQPSNHHALLASSCPVYQQQQHWEGYHICEVSSKTLFTLFNQTKWRLSIIDHILISSYIYTIASTPTHSKNNSMNFIPLIIIPKTVWSSY